MKKIGLFLLTIVFSMIVIMQTSVKVDAEDMENTGDINLNLETINYYNTYNSWLNSQVADGKNNFLITPSELNGGVLYSQSQSFNYDSETVYVQPGDQITFNVNVTNAGLYQLFYDYYILPESRLTPKLKMKVNQETQYNEMNNLEVNVDWTVEKESKYDRFGDQLTPSSKIDLKWQYENGLEDPNHFYVEPLKFKLKKGLNEITFSVLEGYLLIGNIRIENRDVIVPTYEAYMNSLPVDNGSLEELVTIQAEDIDTKSRRSIAPKYMRDPGVTPYSYKNKVFNTLDGDSFSSPGDRVTYTFEVSEAGFYQMALKYYLNLNSGIPSNRRILIDGEVPFKEFENYSFKYQTNWKNKVLSDGQGVPYEIYLEKGIHTVSLEINSSEVKDIYHDLLNILQDIENLALEINNLTGGLVDRERTWNITTYIPTLSHDLKNISDSLGVATYEIIQYTGNDRLPVVTELEIAKELIDEFIEDPEELPGYMTKFSEGSSSAFGRINAILPSLVSSPLNIDAIYFANDHDLPRANANFFVKLISSIKSFFYSFVDPKYNDDQKVDDDTIEIWVNKSRLYVEIMQQKIDNEFTPKTGIKVQLSIMPDEGKIVLANAAGTTPDGAIGITHGRPFELAIRGVIEDLRNYEGFYDLAGEFRASTFVPYIFGEGVYAVPETQDVKLLYYRKDILEQLGLEAPDTLRDVVAMVPTLQKYDMDYFNPLGSDFSFKGFDVTTPYIYQFGGSLYDEETMTTVINRDGAFDAFEHMTDLYTVYNLPTNTSNFFQHFRNGKIPVGVADQNMYIQLRYAAPELAGQWGVLPIPGVENEEGIVERWDPTYGVSSIIFSNSEKKNHTWELIKWWSSADVQADFSYEIQTVLGDRFLYMTANIEGFKESAWPSDSKDEILEQWQWIQATGKVPGDYMLEREISNAFNKVVFDNISARIAIDESITIINREIRRKLEEFGYMDEEGNILKLYRIPTIENVESWVRKNEN